jgi:dTDP-4-dehydrorhamnose reductase
MIRVLVLGASGMLGSMAVRYLRANPELTVACTARQPLKAPYLPGEAIPFSLASEHDLAAAIRRLRDVFQADYILNCIGVINVDCRDHDLAGVLRAVQVNALFPHALAQALDFAGWHARVIHITTDCVYSGSAGQYDEQAVADPPDFYGKSKLLGEVQHERWLNLRCSVIGPDPVRRRSFLEWVLSQPRSATVPGYEHHRWNGVTSLQYARFCEELMRENRFAELRARGPTVHYVPNAAVTKYELVQHVNEVFDRGLRVVPVHEPPPAMDRTLRSLYCPLSPCSVASALVELREFCAVR